MSMDLLYAKEKEELLKVINWMRTDEHKQIDKDKIRELIVNDDCYLSVLEQLMNLKQLGYIWIVPLTGDNADYGLDEDYDLVCAKINQIYNNKRKEFAKETAKLVSSFIP